MHLVPTMFGIIGYVNLLLLAPILSPVSHRSKYSALVGFCFAPRIMDYIMDISKMAELLALKYIAPAFLVAMW